jgi:hypothetical protein
VESYVQVLFYHSNSFLHGGGGSILAEANMVVLPREGEYVIVNGWGREGFGISPYLRARVTAVEHRVFDHTARQPSGTAYVYITPVGGEENDGESSED